MISDVAIASMNRGQFPLAIAGAIVIILILKMPGEDASRLIFELVTLFKDLKITGWVLFFVTIIGWFFNVKWLRRVHTKEIKRMAGEKKSLQEEKYGTNLESSN